MTTERLFTVIEPATMGAFWALVIYFSFLFGGPVVGMAMIGGAIGHQGWKLNSLRQK